MSASSPSATTISLALSRPGDVIDERFRLIEALGPAWRWDRCFKGRDLEREDDVILEIASLPGEPARIDALQKSAAWLSSIRHPNLAELRHFGRHGEDVYAVEKWQSGPTFLQVKRRFPGIRLGHARPLLAHLASGFDALIGRQWTQAFQLDLNEIVVTYEDADQEAAWRKSDSQGWGDMHVRFSPLGKPMAGDGVDLVAIYASLVYELLGGDADAETYEVLPNLSQEGNLLLESFLRESALPGDCGSLLRSLCEIEELPEEDVLKIALLSDEHQALDHGLSHLAELGKKLDAAKREVAASKSSLAKERAAFEAEREAFRRNLQTNRETASESASWHTAKQQFDDREASLNRREEQAKQQFHALKDEVAYLKKRPREIRHSLAQTTVADAQLRGVIDNLKLQLETADTERQKLRKQVRKLESHFDPKAAFRRRLIAGSLTAAAVIVMGSLSWIWGDEAVDLFFPCRAQWQRFQAEAERHFETRDWFAILEDGKKMDDYFHQTPACNAYYEKGAPRLGSNVRRALIEFANPSADPLASGGAAPPESTRPFAYLDHLKALETAAAASPDGPERGVYRSYVDRLTTLDALLTEADDWPFLGDERAAHLASARVGIPLLLHQGNARAALERYVEIYGRHGAGTITEAGRIEFPAKILDRIRSDDADLLMAIIEPLESMEKLYYRLDAADQDQKVHHDLRLLIVQAETLSALRAEPQDFGGILERILEEKEAGILELADLQRIADFVVNALEARESISLTVSLAEDLGQIGESLEMPEILMMVASAYESEVKDRLEEAIEAKEAPSLPNYDQSLERLYTQAARQGHAEAYAALGWHYWEKAQSSVDSEDAEEAAEKAFAVFRALAERGDPNGIYMYADALLMSDEEMYNDERSKGGEEKQMVRKAREANLAEIHGLIEDLEGKGDLRARLLLGRWYARRVTFLTSDREISEALEKVQEALLPLVSEQPDRFPEAYNYLALSRRSQLGPDRAPRDPFYVKYRDLGVQHHEKIALYLKGHDETHLQSLLESALRGYSKARDDLETNLERIETTAFDLLPPHLRSLEVVTWYRQHGELIRKLTKGEGGPNP